MGSVVTASARIGYETSAEIDSLRVQGELKRCTKCDNLKALELFSKNRRKPDGRDLHCRQCIRERIRNKKARQLAQDLCTSCGRPRGDSRSRWYCRKCLTRDSSTRRSREMRAAVIRAYGGESPACVCCSETHAAFLTLDHVNNGGRAHRLEKGNQGVHYELRKGGYPPGFQILCFNCNMAKGYYGSCPHDTEGDPKVGASLRANTAKTGSRICTRCKRELAESEFYLDKIGPGGLQSRCRACTREASIIRLRAARCAALVYYRGGDVRCQCCGEREEKFLALDHIDGGGPRHPTRRSGGNSFFAWLMKQSFPPGLRVLCHNCNCAKGKNRECPHQLRSRRAGVS